MVTQMSEIVPFSDDGGPVPGELQRFEGVLLQRLAAAGLPVEGVLVDLHEREQALSMMGGALRRLPHHKRGRSI